MSTIIPYIYIGVGGCFFLYFLTLWIYCGRIPAFGRFWLLSGIAMSMLGLFTKDYSTEGPDGITTVFFDDKTRLIRNFCIEKLPYLFILFLAVFFILVYILSSGNKKAPASNVDYLILLGARVNGTVPSRALMNRIMTAYHYLKTNPSTKAVLTGGQGPGECITEAQCIKQELLKLGIEESRLLIENQSTSTEENIAYAKKLIIKKHNPKTEIHKEEENKFIKQLTILIVTNDFHTLRGTRLAKKQGFTKVESLGAASSTIMKPHYYVREILSWIKLIINQTKQKLIK